MNSFKRTRKSNSWILSCFYCAEQERILTLSDSEQGRCIVERFVHAYSSNTIKRFIGKVRLCLSKIKSSFPGCLVAMKPRRLFLQWNKQVSSQSVNGCGCVPDPPGPPVIGGYNPNEILRKGEQRTLACSSEGGNPPARLVWTRNGRTVGQVYRTTRRGAVATYTFIVDRSDQHAVYRCKASSKVHPAPMTAHVETIVHCEYVLIAW